VGALASISEGQIKYIILYRNCLYSMIEYSYDKRIVMIGGIIVMAHPVVEIPTDPEGKRRYESAMRHVAALKERGASSEEIHSVYKKIMNGTAGKHKEK